MSGERAKAFAEVKLTAPGFGYIEVAGRAMPGTATEVAAQHLANHINAAVEQREARIVGALQALLNVVDHLPLATFSMRGGKTALTDAAIQAHAALDGHGDYVPRAAVDEANAKLKAYAAACDVLDARESLTAREVVAHLEAAGLRKPEPLADDELIAQLRARGYYVVNPNKQPKPSEAALNGREP